MNRPSVAPRTTLLIHDGELDDVRALLETLETPFCERLDGLGDQDRSASWDVVIASPRRMLDLQFASGSARPTQIAILDQDSRTLRTSLRRAGIELMVRRPFHSATLRALIVHSLYSGPEQRRASRVDVGAPIRLRIGWRQRSALLMDLSVGGCRLATEQRIEPGKAIRLLIPSAISGGKALSLRARVLSCVPDSERDDGPAITTARFERIRHRQHEQLKAAVALHEEGPAICAGANRERAAGARAPESTPLEPAPQPQKTPASPRGAHRAAPTAVDGDSPEKRQSERHLLARRVIALDEEATRVLMGRDISLGGMRVGPNPSLALGMALRLAVHSGGRAMPLVLTAEVYRDDGPRGLVLRFVNLSEDAIRYLGDVVEELPLLDVHRDGHGCLVGEILQAKAGGEA